MEKYYPGDIVIFNKGECWKKGYEEYECTIIEPTKDLDCHYELLFSSSKESVKLFHKTIVIGSEIIDEYSCKFTCYDEFFGPLDTPKDELIPFNTDLILALI